METKFFTLDEEEEFVPGVHFPHKKTRKERLIFFFTRVFPWVLSIILIAVLFGVLLFYRHGSEGGLVLSLSHMRTEGIRGHLKILSSDLYEGREPGTRGEELTVAYISAAMQRAGLEPVVPSTGSYVQAVPLVGFTIQPSPEPRLAVKSSARGPGPQFKFQDNFVIWSDKQDSAVAVEGAAYFVGYGIKAPSYNWDDFKDVDLAGKVLVSFVNDPPATDDEPDLFKGPALTYYGRWTYKFEEARRRKALGVVLIHTDETAGYPFSVLNHSHEYMELDGASGAHQLSFKAWLTKDLATALLASCGLSFDDMVKAAASRTFSPIPLNTTIKADFSQKTRHFEAMNVAGIIRGTQRTNESVVLTAHHDHLGILPNSAEADNIFNGAIDNAIGVAMMLNVMSGLAVLPPPARTLLFLFVTAEEKGLLGSAHYVAHPLLPLNSTVANINIDGGNVWGRTSDVVGIGAEASSLGALLADAAHDEGMTVTRNPTAEREGSFFRSDQLSFAQGGVPGIDIQSGCGFVGQADPAAFCAKVHADYTAHRYHQPSDEYDASWDLEGALQVCRIAARMAWRLAESIDFPKFVEGSAFHRPSTNPT